MARAWIIPAVLQVALPFALLIWQLSGTARHRLTWALTTLIVTGYLVATMLAGLWLVVPVSVAAILLALSALMAMATYPSDGDVSPSHLGGRDRLSFAAGLLALGVILATICVALLGRVPPPRLQTVHLEFPLRDGTYYVANGGSHALINAHVSLVNDARFTRFRGAAYGIDVVRLNDFGLRATGIAPGDPARYDIFGDRVFAPCEGIVARSEDGLPDLAPPTVDRAHLPGNFVLIECDDAHVLLAHLRFDSVTVHPGDYVTINTVVGRVGNSGNSDEPHLHIHAQRPGVLWDPFNADPLPMQFGRRFLVRNDRVTNRTAESEDIDD
jgi:hypothetical protein